MKYFLLLCMTSCLTYGMDLDSLHISDYDCRLHQAVDAGDVEKLKELLAQGVAVDKEDRNGETPLVFAVKKKNYTMMQILLNAGASPNVSWGDCCGDYYPEGPLLQGMIDRDDMIASALLLQYGANINKPNEWGNPPLFRVTSSAACALLLRAGSLINGTTRQGESFLFNHFKYRWRLDNFLALCVLSLNYGANPNQKGHLWHGGEEQHILKLGSHYDIPFEGFVALMLSGAAPARKTSPEGNELRMWVEQVYPRRCSSSQILSRMKLLRDLYVCPDMLSKKLKPEILKGLDIAPESITTVRHAAKKVRQEFLHIAQDTPAFKPTKQKATIFKALQLRELGARK